MAANNYVPGTSLGRVSPEFIPGRGYIVGRGKARKLQIALPSENRGWNVGQEDGMEQDASTGGFSA